MRSAQQSFTSLGFLLPRSRKVKLENALTQAPPLWYVTAWGMLKVAEMMFPVKESSGLAARISERDSRRAIVPLRAKNEDDSGGFVELQCLEEVWRRGRGTKSAAGKQAEVGVG